MEELSQILALITAVINLIAGMTTFILDGGVGAHYDDESRH